MPLLLNLEPSLPIQKFFARKNSFAKQRRLMSCFCGRSSALSKQKAIILCLRTSFSICSTNNSQTKKVYVSLKPPLPGAATPNSSTSMLRAAASFCQKLKKRKPKPTEALSEDLSSLCPLAGYGSQLAFFHRSWRGVLRTRAFLLCSEHGPILDDRGYASHSHHALRQCVAHVCRL